MSDCVDQKKNPLGGLDKEEEEGGQHDEVVGDDRV